MITKSYHRIVKNIWKRCWKHYT